MDLVTITNKGGIYANYEEWIKYYVPSRLQFFKNGSYPNSNPFKAFKVLFTGAHLDYRNRLITLIEDTGTNQVYLFDNDSIKSFPKEKDDAPIRIFITPEAKAKTLIVLFYNDYCDKFEVLTFPHVLSNLNAQEAGKIYFEIYCANNDKSRAFDFIDAIENDYTFGNIPELDLINQKDEMLREHLERKELTRDYAIQKLQEEVEKVEEVLCDAVGSSLLYNAIYLKLLDTLFDYFKYEINDYDHNFTVLDLKDAIESLGAQADYIADNVLEGIGFTDWDNQILEKVNF